MEGTLFLKTYHKDEYSFIDIYDVEDYKNHLNDYGSDIMWFHDAKNISDPKWNKYYDACWFGDNGIHRAVTNLNGKTAIDLLFSNDGIVFYPVDKRIEV